MNQFCTSRMLTKTKLTSNLLGVCRGIAVGLSSSVMPSLVSLCVMSSWLKLRPIILRSSKSAALLSLVSLHTLFSRLRDFRMDFLGIGSPFFTSTNNLTQKQESSFIRCSCTEGMGLAEVLRLVSHIYS